MAGLSITDFALAPDEWSVDQQSQDFESAQFAAREDAKRARMLRKRASKLTGTRRSRMLALADKLDPQLTPEIPKTPASARYIRSQRIRIISWTWKAVAEDSTGKVARFDVIKPAWAVDRKGLRKTKSKRICNEFRADLNRAALKLKPGGAAQCNGFLIAFLHGEHESRSKLFQLHFHVVATGDWVAVLDRLKKVKAYRPTKRVKRPVRARRKLDDLAYALTYLLKLYWPGKWRGKVSGQKNQRRRRKHGRISEPYHSDVLLWLNNQSLKDLVVMMKVRAGTEGLIVKSVYE